MREYWETKRSNLYKELHQGFWDKLLTNPKFQDYIGLIIAGTVVGVLIIMSVLIGH